MDPNTITPPLNILFQDDSLIVVDKPAGLVSTPSDTSNEETLAGILNRDYGLKLERGGLVHRLDKNTSGVILAAKTQAAFDNLQAQFKERTTKKEYLALVHGSVVKDGVVEGSIIRNPGDREKFIVDAAGKEATTHYKIIKRLRLSEEKLAELFPDYSKIQMKKLLSNHYPDFSLLQCLPKTGRTHQIRVHLKYINFPIVGDEKYGGRKTARLDHRWCPRQFLHAAKITFHHPVSGEEVSFESPLPEDLKKALSFLVNE